MREKLLREEENLHEMYNSSHHVNNKNGKENESHKNEDDITSETTGGGVVITDDILAASKKKGRTNSLDERQLVGLVSTMTPKTATASASSLFFVTVSRWPFR